MTEHSKIPVPPKGDGEIEEQAAKRSLFERANGSFGLDSFGSAPVPKAVQNAPAKPAPKPAPKQNAAPEADPVENVSQDVGSKFATPADYVPTVDVASENVAVPTAQESASSAIEAVQFSGAKHEIDRDHLRNQGMIVPDATVTALVEEFRIVKRQIIAAAKTNPDAQRVLVCSPLPGEGKTFTAVNLALAMAAEKDVEIVLVDADFAKPSVLSTLGLPGGPGLMDALSDSAVKVEDLVIGTDVPGLWVLPAGEQTNSDSEYLTSARTAEVLTRLTQGAPNRMVIFDSPPALAASPAAELAKYVGQAVLIARADSTGESALEDAYQLLSSCSDIKLLLNAAKFSPSGRRFGTYYGYEG